jgi:hypothetical protein
VSGTGTASAIGSCTFTAAGSASGSAIVLGVGVGFSAGSHGTASGAGTASGISYSWKKAGPHGDMVSALSLEAIAFRVSVNTDETITSPATTLYVTTAASEAVARTERNESSVRTGAEDLQTP